MEILKLTSLGKLFFVINPRFQKLYHNNRDKKFVNDIVKNVKFITFFCLFIVIVNKIINF